MAGHERDETRADVPVDTATVVRGTQHTAVAQVVTQTVRFVSNVVLARLLTPDDFGVFAVALVISMFLDQLRDMGTGAAIIQRERVDQALLDSVFYLNLLIGVVLAVGLYLVAPSLAAMMGDPGTTPALRALAMITLVAAFGQIHHSLLRRDLRFYEIAVVSSVNAVVTGLVSIVAALLGAGYWALILGIAAGTVVNSAMVWVYDKWRPTLRVSLSSLRSIWRYSYHLFLSNLLFLFFNQVDKIIVIHFLGKASLGTYTLAQRTVTSPVQSLVTVVNEVAFPAFARRQDDNAALHTGLIRSARVVALITFPAMAGLTVLAQPAVDVVFGSKWSELVPIIWILAPISALLSVSGNSYQVLLAKGRTDISYRWGIVYCVVLTCFELVGVRWGLVGVALGYALGILIVTPIGMWLAYRLIDLRVRDYFRRLVPQAVITLVMAAVAWVVWWGLADLGAADAVSLLAGTLAGALVYAGLLLWWRPPAVADMMVALSRRRG